jgi:hypothetical protein
MGVRFLASPLRKPEHFPIRREVDETEASRQTLTQFHFSNPREELRRAIKVIAITSGVVVALLAALVYFAGIIAGAVAVGVLVLLVKFGDSVLDDTIDLR